MSRLHPIGIVLGTLFLSMGLVLAQPAETRKPIPQKTDVAAAEKLVRELFKADFAKTKAADRSAFAAKLLEQADDSKDDPAAKYVLLREARETSAKAGDFESFLRAADGLSTEFTITVAEARTVGVDTLAANIPAAGARVGGQALVDASDAALGSGEFDAAQKLLRAAELASRKANLTPLSTAIALRTRSLPALRKEFDKLDAARKTLETTPTDADANLLLGRFLCFVKNDWDAGLPHLVLGSDKTLREAAEKEDKAKNGSASEKADVAEMWYKIGVNADALQKSNLMARALASYREAQSEATGLGKVKIDRRVEELTKTIPGAAANAGAGAAWNVFKTAVKEWNVKEWPTVGTDLAIQKFVDVPAAGGVLIGFRFNDRSGATTTSSKTANGKTTTTTSSTRQDYIQPIYRGAKGEFFGTAVGKIRLPVNVVKAKDGYAVGKLVVHSSGRYLYGLQPTFMKLNKAALDPTDSYQGPLIGNTNGESDTLGDGSPILGIHGRWNPGTLNVSTVSLVTLGTGGDGTKKSKN